MAADGEALGFEGAAPRLKTAGLGLYGAHRAVGWDRAAQGRAPVALLLSLAVRRKETVDRGGEGVRARSGPAQVRGRVREFGPGERNSPSSPCLYFFVLKAFSVFAF
jgi:hypothetical protein